MPLNFIAKAAIQVGVMVATTAIGMMRKIEGPRLDDLKFTGGDYGSPLSMIWGIRRLQVPIFWAEDLKEVKRQRKTKGGKYNEYTYYGTFAVALAGHQIAAIRRVWFDTHLVFDLSGAGPVTPFDFGDGIKGQIRAGATDKAVANGGKGNPYFAFYPGSETQQPDPRIQATVEAEFGEGSCPAYRGTAYIVFKDIPLEKLGNRIPQVSVEVVSVASALWPYEEIDTTEGGDQLYFAPDFSVLYSGSYTGMAILDTAARQPFNQFAGSFSGIGNRFAPMNDGDFIALSGAGDIPYLYDVYGGVTGPIDPNVDLRNLTSTADADGTMHWLAKRTSTSQRYFDGVEIGTGLSGTVSFTDLDGNIWEMGYPDSTSVEFHQLVGNQTGAISLTVSSLPSFGGGPTGAAHYRDDTTDRFVFSRDGIIYAIDRDDGTIVDTYSAAHGSPVFENIRPGVTTIWAGFYEIKLADFTLVRSLQPSTYWGLSISITAPVSYDPINHALVRFGATGPQWLYLDRVGSPGVALSVIAGDVADWVGVEDYDFSDLNQTIPGWSATRGAASNMLEPLFDAYDSDIRPHDFTIQGIKRTGTTGGTLLTERFVKNEPRYSVKVRGAAELPAAVMVNFADTDADQQPNTVRSSRPLASTDARGERTMDMTTLAVAPTAARGLGDRFFRRLWNERKEVSLSLTAQQLKLEPGDVRTLDLDDETLIARLVKLTVQANDVLATEWKYDHPSLAVIDGASGAAFDGRDPSVITVPLLSRGFFLDIPYISDADAQTPPIIYVLAAPLADGSWPGAVAYQAIDGEYSDEIASVASSSQATWGYAATALPNTNPNIWDRGSSITVTLQVGTLTGCTEAAIDANPLLNLALIGDEYVQFTTATLTATLTYTVSGFKRGRRGTEWACATHAARDVFLMLNTAQDVAMGLSEVGTNLDFKAITAGRTTGFPVHLEPYTGASLKPYAPCQLAGLRNFATNDWVLTWVRRTRVGGAWTSGTAIPLSEVSEEYEVEIMNGASVVRTITALSSPTTTYTSAQQVTDFGSNQSAVTFRVYQISDAVDRGFMATATA